MTETRTRWWKTSDAEGVREHTGIHEGTGVIRVKSFFDDRTTTGLHLHHWELAPGATEGRHTHPAENPRDNWEELYYVLSGHGVATFDDGSEVPLAPGEALLVPVDVDHGLENRCDEPLRIVLVFARPARSTSG